MIHPTVDPAIPDPAERARRTAALHADIIETGFSDDHDRLAPRLDDIDQWQPEACGPANHQPDEQPFQPAQLERSAVTPLPGA